MGRLDADSRWLWQLIPQRAALLRTLVAKRSKQVWRLKAFPVSRAVFSEVIATTVSGRNSDKRIKLELYANVPGVPTLTLFKRDRFEWSGSTDHWVYINETHVWQTCLRWNELWKYHVRCAGEFKTINRSVFKSLQQSINSTKWTKDYFKRNILSHNISILSNFEFNRVKIGSVSHALNMRRKMPAWLQGWLTSRCHSLTTCTTVR